MNLPSVRQLECLVAVEKTRHFGRAAEACFITQPALSHQIQQLEGRLGLTLFERDRRRVVPTRAGEALAARARSILGDLRDFSDSAAAFTEPLSGPLRLGVIPTVAPYVLPRTLGVLRNRHPGLELTLREGQTAELVRELFEGNLDVLFLAREADLGGARTLDISRDPFLLAVPTTHPLASRKRARESDLDGEEVLLLEDGHCLRDQALTVCDAAGATELGNFRASSLATLLRLVESGLGVTLLPRISVEAETGPGRSLCVIPFPMNGPARTLCLAWRPHALRSGEYKLLGETLRAAIDDRSGH